MQPVQHRDFVQTSVNEDHSSTQTPVLEAEPEVHDPEKAISQQELFTLGVRSGGVLQVQEVEVVEKLPTTEDRLASFMKGVIDEIGSEVQQQGISSFLSVSLEDIEALDAYKETASAEVQAVFKHFTALMMAHYSPIVSQLQDHFKHAFLVAIQGAIIPKMAHAQEEIAKISPEFLRNLVLAAPFYVYVAKQGQIMKKLEQLEPPVLEELHSSLVSDEKQTFLVENKLEAVQELKSFLDSLPEQIRGSLTEGFVVGIQDVLKNK